MRSGKDTFFSLLSSFYEGKYLLIKRKKNIICGQFCNEYLGTASEVIADVRMLRWAGHLRELRMN